MGVVVRSVTCDSADTSRTDWRDREWAFLRVRWEDGGCQHQTGTVWQCCKGCPGAEVWGLACEGWGIGRLRKARKEPKQYCGAEGDWGPRA